MNLLKAKKDIVEFLYQFDENDYPSICILLDLKPGNIQEASHNKEQFLYSRLDNLSQEKILEILRKINEIYNENLIPEEKYNYKLSELTKRDIKKLFTDGLEIDTIGLGISSETIKMNWHGCITELEFIKRITDITSIKVIDPKCKNFEEEFIKHRILNDDYDNDYFFEDDRLPFKTANDETYLNIICEMFHPIVREEESYWQNFLNMINELIHEDGFEIIQSGKISGRNIFSWKRITYFDDDYIKPSMSIIYETFDSKFIRQQLDIMNKAVNNNTALAIGKAKELLETCYKYISNKKNIILTKEDNLMQMDKKIRKILKFEITAENKDIPGIAILCSGLSNIVHGISELRNSFGDGHGKDAELFNPLSPSYAKLIVYTVVNYVNFLISFL